MSPNTTIHFHSSHMIPKTFKMIEVNHYQIPSANNTTHTKPNNLTQTHTDSENSLINSHLKENQMEYTTKQIRKTRSTNLCSTQKVRNTIRLSFFIINYMQKSKAYLIYESPTQTPDTIFTFTHVRYISNTTLTHVGHQTSDTTLTLSHVRYMSNTKLTHVEH